MAKVQGDDVWLVEVSDDPARARKTIEALPFVKAVAEEEGLLRVTLRPGSGHAPEIPAALLRDGLKLRQFRLAEATLEDAFLKLTKGDLT
jgi:ABC-type uncharacterized transport system ATPase subunit